MLFSSPLYNACEATVPAAARAKPTLPIASNILEAIVSSFALIYIISTGYFIQN